MKKREIEIRRPDDWHLHLRDGNVLADILSHTVKRFRRAIIMPNLKPPITTVQQALQYRKRILRALPQDRDLHREPQDNQQHDRHSDQQRDRHSNLQRTFEPLMTLFLTEETTVQEIGRAATESSIHAVKLYPAGATTNSQAGVNSFEKLYPVLEAMEKVGLPLLVHGEVNDPHTDIFDREARFIDWHLEPIVRKFQGLKIVFEHISSKNALDYLTDGPDRLAATVTAHHLLLNRNALFAGGLRPHNYCLPVVKRESDRRALVEAVTGKLDSKLNRRLFLGTDSAPHAQGMKENSCGCAGIYTAHCALELYAEVFELAGAWENFEAFTSINGPNFYGLPVNEEKISLIKKRDKIPESYKFGSNALVPFRAGEYTEWSLT